MAANLKQKATAKNLALQAIHPRFKTLAELLLASGYSLSTSMNASGEIIRSKGVQEELEKLGFNELAANARVSEILLTGKDNDSLKAAELIYKVRGSFAPEKHLNLNLFGSILKDIEDNDTSIVNEE